MTPDPRPSPSDAPRDGSVSVVIPIFNEVATVEELVHRVRQVPFEKEIVLVDDASTDGSHEVLEEIAARHDDTRLLVHKVNQGKGAALRTGFEAAGGEIIIIQDADLELDPEEYPSLLAPIQSGQTDLVYGSRFLVPPEDRPPLVFYTANRALTFLTNIVAGVRLTDMATCYKVFRKRLLGGIPLRCNRFAIDPELTMKFARRGHRIFEVPVSYHPRSHEEGKKVSWKDGIAHVLAILWFRIFD